MASLTKTLSILQKSFDTKNGPALSREQLIEAQGVLRTEIAQKPENTQLPWFLARVENRLHLIATGEQREDPPRPDLSEAEKKSTRRAGIGGLVVLAAVIGGCSLLVSNNNGDEDEDAGGDEIGASVICEQFMEDRLRSPGTAEFASYPDQAVTGGPTRFVVQSYVDSENGFGALLRTDYTCTVTSTDGDSWTLVDLVTSD